MSELNAEPQDLVGGDRHHRVMNVHHNHDDESVLLCGGCSGQWAVETASGTFYVLDLDAMTQTRVPDPDRIEVLQTSTMRLDGAPVTLLAIGSVRLGVPLCMWVDVVGDGVRLTWRRTNLVVGVRALAGHGVAP